jgi:cyclic pyranopterin phosphate synthase
MDKVDVKCGFLCNNRCVFCVQGNKRETYGDLPTERILASLAQSRADADQLVLTGGEPTIKKDFLLLVRKAKELGFRLIQIQTNGRMFASRAFCEETVAAGATDFSLALHGHTPGLHDYLTRTPDSFWQTVKGIRNLVEMEQTIGTNTVITRSNFRHLPALARFLVRLGVRQYQFAFVHALGTAAENFRSVVPRYALIEPYVKQGLDPGIAAGVTVMTEAIPYCFMSNYEEYIAERIIPRTKIFDVHVLEDYTHYRLTEGKSKGECCARCARREVCEGPWKEYPETYGWSEFNPVRE